MGRKIAILGRVCKKWRYLGLAILFVSMGSGCYTVNNDNRTTVTYSDEAAAKEGEQIKGSWRQ